MKDLRTLAHHALKYPPRSLMWISRPNSVLSRPSVSKSPFVPSATIRPSRIITTLCISGKNIRDVMRDQHDRRPVRRQPSQQRAQIMLGPKIQRI